MIIVGDIASPTVEMTEKLEKFLSDSTILKIKI